LAEMRAQTTMPFTLNWRFSKPSNQVTGVGDMAGESSIGDVLIGAFCNLLGGLTMQAWANCCDPSHRPAHGRNANPLGMQDKGEHTP
jgi:hypothetical protein